MMRQFYGFAVLASVMTLVVGCGGSAGLRLRANPDGAPSPDFPGGTDAVLADVRPREVSPSIDMNTSLEAAGLAGAGLDGRISNPASPDATADVSFARGDGQSRAVEVPVDAKSSPYPNGPDDAGLDGPVDVPADRSSGSADGQSQDTGGNGGGGAGGAGGAGGTRTGGTTASGGSVSSGGNVVTGGVSTGGAGGTSTGGTVASGGSASSGGSVATGGVSTGGAGGTVASGGAVSSGGSVATGGVSTGGAGGTSTGGTIASGGAVSSGGSVATGGVSTGGAGGTFASGGAVSSGGSVATGGVSTGGTVATGGATEVCEGAPEPRPDAASTPDVPVPPPDACTTGSCVDSPAANPTWITSWFRTPISTTIVADTTATDSPPYFSNQTVRLMLWPTTGGTQVKVKFTNLYTAFPVSIGAAHIALRSGTGANIVSGSDRTLTFGGLSTISLAANSEMWSDPVVLTVTAYSDLAVSIYLPGSFTPTTMMARGELKTSYYKSDNQVSASTMTGASTTTKDVFVSEVQVLSPASASEIAVDGDSIVEGACSDLNANGDWPDLLSNRLPSLPSGAKVGIANAGVGSGRFVSTCPSPNVNCAGPSGLSRLPSLLALPGIRFVIVSMGINDISYNSISASGLISAYQTAISQSHSAGVKIFGVPLLPIKSSVKDTPSNEATRATVNAWIRGGTTGYDGVIDFEPIVSDPNDPDSFRSDLTCDHVHPNQAGYTLMANSIDLSLFQ